MIVFLLWQFHNRTISHSHNYQNMLKYFFLSLSLILILSLSSFAQTDIDALRYSQSTSGATARSLAVGGAFGALGGDLSSANINPGGLGVFRASEIALTPTVNQGGVTSDFSGNTTDTDNNRWRIAGVGAAFVTLTDRYENDWKATTFAITYNQVANLDKRFSYENTTNGSIVESFLEQANGLFPEQLGGFYERLALDVDLIYNPDQGYLDFYGADLDANSSILKAEVFAAKGSIYEMGFSVGANYRHDLYIGATLGLPILNYTQETRYREEDQGDQYEFFNNMTYTERFATTGAGLNLKVGAIYRINRMFRVGLAAHTPTTFGLTDTEFDVEMDYSITYDINEGPTLNRAATSADPVDYMLKTPWRVIASGGAIIPNFGFVSADVEWVNYSKSRYTFDTDLYSFYEGFAEIVNGDITANYTSAINARLGAEYRYKIFRARAGYAYYGNPFDSSVETDSGARQNISFGLGVRPESVYLDLALVRNMSNELYVPYRTNNSPNVQEINNDIGNTRIVLTGGFKF